MCAQRSPRGTVAGFALTTLCVGCAGLSADWALCAEPEDSPGASRSSRSQIRGYGDSTVNSISREQLQLSGASRIEDVLNTVPMMQGDMGGYLYNGATGTASVNLHGLGAQRTLVLVNGRRLMSGDPTRAAHASADLNQIPVALVERIDVLTGSAAALYGNDAAAGVVNFLMKNNFEGMRIDAQYSSFLHAQKSNVRQFLTGSGPVPDGRAENVDSIDAMLLWGQNFAGQRGNITIHAGYRATSAIDETARDFGICPVASGLHVFCASQSTSVPGRFFGNDGGDYSIGAGNVLVPYAAISTGSTGYLLRPDKRFTTGLEGHYDLDHARELYTELAVMRDRTTARTVASGAFLGAGNAGNGAWNINCNNPYLAPSMVSAFCVPGSIDANGNTQLRFARSNAEGGTQVDELQHTAIRAVLGTRGELRPGWRYDVYGAYGSSRLLAEHSHDISIARLGNALLAVTDPLSGQVVCKANANGVNGAPGCVPYNIFQLGRVTSGALAYIDASGTQHGSNNEWILSGTLSGDLQQDGLRLPWAKHAIGVRFGAEYRSQRAALKVDQAFASGDLAGLRGTLAPMSSGLRSWDVFSEFHLPVVQDKLLSKDLSFDASTRFTHHSIGAATNAYRVSLTWLPIRDVQLHAVFDQSERAPNVQELFAGNQLQYTSLHDPCAGANPTATAADCAHTGVNAAQYGHITANPDNRYYQLSTANSQLRPEAVHSSTLGIVLTPRFLPKLRVALDYFQIDIKRSIGALDAGSLMNFCIASGDPAYCDAIHRAPGNGSLWLGSSGYIESRTRNLGKISLTGANGSLSYLQGLGWFGSLQLNLLETTTLHQNVQAAPGEPTYDCAGLYGTVCGVQVPRFRYTARGTWITPIRELSLSIQMRHISSLQLDRDFYPKISGLAEPADASTAVSNYMDLSISYALSPKASLRIGMNNVTDFDPPLLPANSRDGTRNIVVDLSSANTYPQIYDTLGRHLFISVAANF